MQSSCLILKLKIHLLYSTGQSNGDVRLVGGPAANEGRLELYTDGRFGPLCSRSTFRIEEADVFCRQLGYVGAQNYGTIEEFR